MKKSKYSVWVIQLLAVLILAGISAYTVLHTGILSNLGQEDIYWERARFLLGQQGASNYNGSSLCSLGYSLLLVPICAVLKSPYAAYKAAVLLNGCFLCIAYLVSVRTARKLFPEEKAAFLSAACFFAALCPVLAAARSFTGPETLLVLLAWLSLYLLISLKEAYSRKKLILLAGCMIAAGFLQISLLGMIGAVVIILAVCVKKKKLEETSFLYFCLAVLLGLALGNVAERVFLHFFAADLDVTVTSSLELFLDGMMKGWENNYLLGLFRGLTGKLYALFAGSFLLLCPGLWYCLRGLFPEKNGEHGKARRLFCAEPLLIFGLVLFTVTLYDNSQNMAVALTSVKYVETALPMMLLLGAVQLKKAACPAKELTGYLLALCLCALVTANLYQTQGISSISAVNNGILMLFQDWDMTPVASVYALACLVILAAILFWFGWTFRGKGKGLVSLLRWAAVLGAGGCYLIFGLLVCRHTAVQSNESSTENIAPIAAVISETELAGDCYYLMGTGSDQNISVLQSLMPGKQIHLQKNNGKERTFFYEEAASGEISAELLITGTGESLIEETMPQELPDYRLSYMTRSYALWVRRGSETEENLERTVSGRLQYLALRSTSIQETAVASDEEIAEENPETEMETETEMDPEDALPAGEELLDNEDAEAEGAEAEGLEGEGAEAEEAEALEGEEAEAEEAEGLEGEGAEAKEAEALEGEDAEAEEAEGETETENTAEEDETDTFSEAFTSMKKVYGGRTYLAPGTYRMEVYLKKLDERTGLDGTLRLACTDGTILTEEVDDSVFADGQNGTVVIEFTSREAIRNFRLVFRGTLAGHAEITDIYYWKTSPGYTLGINGNSSMNSVCRTIRNLDSQNGSAGTVSFVGEASIHPKDYSMRCFEERLPGYTVEAISREAAENTEATYVIGVNSPYSYYCVMENYTVISRTKTYSLLARNDSEQYQQFLENGGAPLSEGRSLLSAAFTRAESAGGPFALDPGSYIFRGTVQSPAAGTVTVVLKNGEETIAEQEISGNTAELSFALNKRNTKLSCFAETEEGDVLEVTDWSIELASENYQFGQEEALEPLFKIIRDLGDGVTVAAVLESDKIREADTQYDYLQEQLPGASVEVRSYTEANNAVDDPLLLTCGLSESYLRLLGKYCILGHAGEYTLWARCEGANVQKAMENGVEVLSSGKKISPASLMAVTGAENASEAIAELPETIYNVYLEVDVSEIEKDDTIEFLLLCDKTEKEIEDEIEELMDEGYTRREAREEAEEQVIVGSATYETYGLEGENEMVYAIRTNQNRGLLNLAADAYTWKAETVECEIVWIEIA